jgi:hypothetical protein
MESVPRAVGLGPPELLRIEMRLARCRSVSVGVPNFARAACSSCGTPKNNDAKLIEPA